MTDGPRFENTAHDQSGGNFQAAGDIHVSQQSRSSGETVAIWGAAVIGAAAAIIAAIIAVAPWEPDPGPEDVQPVFEDDPGQDPYTPPVDDLAVVPELVQRVDYPTGSGLLPPQGKSLYSHDGTDSLCDRDALAAALQAEPAKAEAWAKTLEISPDSIPTYLQTLTPKVLLFDQRVTNHGYRDGSSYSYQAVLQAGTTVLIDNDGNPRVRCRCGNPLLGPVLQDNNNPDTYTGATWNGFNPETIARYKPIPDTDTIPAPPTTSTTTTNSTTSTSQASQPEPTGSEPTGPTNTPPTASITSSETTATSPPLTATTPSTETSTSSSTPQEPVISSFPVTIDCAFDPSTIPLTCSHEAQFTVAPMGNDQSISVTAPSHHCTSVRYDLFINGSSQLVGNLSPGETGKVTLSLSGGSNIAIRATGIRNQGGCLADTSRQLNRWSANVTFTNLNAAGPTAARI